MTSFRQITIARGIDFIFINFKTSFFWIIALHFFISFLFSFFLRVCIVLVGQVRGHWYRDANIESKILWRMKERKKEEVMQSRTSLTFHEKSQFSSVNFFVISKQFCVTNHQGGTGKLKRRLLNFNYLRLYTLTYSYTRRVICGDVNV